MSLKAELLRKQQEVNKTNKLSASDPFKVFNPRGANDKKKLGDKIKSKNENSKPEPTAPIVTNEEMEMLAKSKRILEAKTKLYDRMTASGGALNSDDRCLVRFNQKKQDDRQNKPLESSSSESDNDSEDSILNEDDDKWTEYTDCLGRTRRCLKEDLAFFKRKDQDLVHVAREKSIANEEKPSQDWFVDTKGISSADLPLYKASTTGIDDDSLSMISKSTKADEMRQQWEQKEQDNINRDEIHYQDVLFNEARSHGVGFYAFSSDKSERLKQQHALETEREKTLNAQKQRDQVRLYREKIIADRVFAAKNRQRARLGLPPLDQEEINKANDEEKSKESKEERKRKKKEEKERLQKEELDRKREAKRKQHIRKWDQGKDGVQSRRMVSDSDSDEWEYKPEKPEPMSQEQWNEMKRAERNKEFAPPTSSFDAEPIINEMNSFNRFTTIKPKAFKRRNAEPVANMFNEPIRNELDGNDFPVDDYRNEDRSNKRGAEIAPPPTFDYYGPTSSSCRPKTHVPPNNDICSSIDAGLQFLREKSDKGIVGTKQSWVANKTYEQP